MQNNVLSPVHLKYFEMVVMVTDCRNCVITCMTLTLLNETLPVFQKELMIFRKLMISIRI